MCLTADATFGGPDQCYRYTLTRAWTPGPRVNFIMLNPSTADATTDDATIRRCLRYAQDWGYGGLVVTNLYAYRATDPRVLKTVADPIGPRNDAVLRAQARAVNMVVCAWGAGGGTRAQGVRRLLRSEGVMPWALRFTKAGHPSHPLRLPARLNVVRYFDPEE